MKSGDQLGIRNEELGILCLRTGQGFFWGVYVGPPYMAAAALLSYGGRRTKDGGRGPIFDRPKMGEKAAGGGQ